MQMIMQTQTFVPFVPACSSFWNKSFWLAQAVPEEFSPFVPLFHKYNKGTWVNEHTLQCIQREFCSSREPFAERYTTGTEEQGDNERINTLLIKGFLPVPFFGTRRTRWNNTEFTLLDIVKKLCYNGSNE